MLVKLLKETVLIDACVIDGYYCTNIVSTG